jgi:ABC-type branched-subunit amino acid transport system substrate-binding protein
MLNNEAVVEGKRDPVGRKRGAVVVVGAMVVVAVVVAVIIASTRDSGRKAPADTSATAPITILWVGDTTGPAKVYGDAQLAGVQGAADYFNDRGGIGGHRVVVEVASDNADPAIAASTLTEKLSSSSPTMVWAGSISADSAAMIPILARHKVFAISLIDGQAQCQSNASTACPNEWFLSTPSSVVQQTVVDWIKSRATKVGVLEETTPYSAAETPQFLNVAATNGLIATTVSFPSTAVDLTPQMQQLQQAGSQVVYSEGIGSAQYAFAARAKLGWDVPLVFDPAASALDLTKLTSPENTKNAFLVNAYGQDARTSLPGLDTMVTWAGRHGEITTLPLNVTGTGWDTVVALNAAVVAAGGSVDVDDLNRAMLKLPPTDQLRTLTHQLGFTADNHVNVLGTPEDFVVIPVGPIVNGRVQAP